MAPLHRSSAPQPQTQPQPHQLQIQHFTHQHPLHKLYMGSQFNCDGCKTAGYGLRYRCAACDFDLHEQCATSPHRISSHLHPHHHLLLVNRPGTSHFCDVCKGFADGLSYTCHSQTCEFDVHPLCTGTPVATGIPSAGFNNQQVMINKQQQQQGVATTAFGGYNNNQPVMMINQQYQQFQQQQQQGMGFGGYNGVNNNQQVMINQQQGMGFGGYNNQPQPVMMMNQQQQQQQQGRTSNYSNVGKIAANILMTSLIGVPLNFNSKN